MTVLHNHPPKMPVAINYGIFARELADAQYALGLLEGLQRKLLNPSLLIAPLTAKEAAVSSKIEGTQSTASDVFLYEAGGEAKFGDTAEVANYKKAMSYAVKELGNSINLTPYFIKSIHSILLNGVRHKGIVGDFRGGPVWIAQKFGDPIEKATYVPPENILVPEYIDNLVEYINHGDENILVLAGLAHYQFEAIHPFDDGNGRIGRLMVPLLLHYKGQLSLPIIYLSGYFDRHRDEYIDALHDVDTTCSYEPWISFFLKAVTEQSQETRNLIEGIYDLSDKLKDEFHETKSPYLIHFLEYIFKQPIFSIPKVIEDMGISRLTATRFIELLEAKKIIKLVSSTDNKTNYYAFDPLLKLLQ